MNVYKGTPFIRIGLRTIVNATEIRYVSWKEMSSQEFRLVVVWTDGKETTWTYSSKQAVLDELEKIDQRLKEVLIIEEPLT